MSKTAPPYPQAKNLLAGKTVLVTAAAGTGIGYWVARRASEEGATVMISDIHERRLAEAAEQIEKFTGQRPATTLCNVTDEEQVHGRYGRPCAQRSHAPIRRLRPA